MEKINEVFSKEQSSQERIDDVFLSYSDSADIKFELLAPVNIRLNRSNRIIDQFPEGIEVRFITNSEVFATLTANNAERNSRDHKTVLRDNVLFVNKNGEHLRTSEMIWDEKNGEIYSTKYTILRSEDKLIQGYGFFTDEDFDKITVGSLEGKLSIKSEE